MENGPKSDDHKAHVSRNLSRKASRNHGVSRHPRSATGYSHSSSSLPFRILKRVTPASPRAGRPSAADMTTCSYPLQRRIDSLHSSLTAVHITYSYRHPLVDHPLSQQRRNQLTHTNSALVRFAPSASHVGSLANLIFPFLVRKSPMLVTIKKVSSGICIWCCQKSDETLEVEFRDGFQGILCRKDFWIALKSRSEKPREESRSAAK